MNSFYNESVKNSIDDKRTESDKTKQARTGLQADKNKLDDVMVS